MKGGRPYKVHEDLTRIRTAVQENDLFTVKAIVQNHGINSYDGEKQTALIWASIFKQVDLLKWLIDNDADVNQQDKTGYTGLHFCGQAKSYEVAKILLNNGANPNIQDEHGNSPLWTAFFNSKGDFQMVKLLREFGADPNRKNKYGRSPNDLARTIYQNDLDELIK